MHLTWMLTDRLGKELNYVYDRQGGQVRVELNGQRTASVSLSVEEDVVRRIRPGRTRLKIFCHPLDTDPSRYMLFNGAIIEPKADRRRMEVSAVDQSIRLLNASPAPLPPLADVDDFWWEEVNDEQSEIMWRMINKSDEAAEAARINEAPKIARYVLTLGIKKGDLANSRLIRTARFADGKTTWDAIRDYALRNRAPDFELEPLDREDGIHAAFNTFHPRQGEDKRDSVILEEGHNVSDYSVEPSGVDLCNRYVLVGKPNQFGVSNAYVAEAPFSWKWHGIWQRMESAPDITDVDELKRRAEAYIAVRAHRVPFVDVSPAVEIGGTARGFSRDAVGNLVAQEQQFAIPPTFGPGDDWDYWLGDRITFRGSKYAFNYDVDRPGRGAPEGTLWTRVIAANFTEVGNGANVMVDLETAPVTAKAFVRGFETRIRTDSY